MSSIWHRIRHPGRKTTFEPGASATRSRPGAIRHRSRQWPAYRSDELVWPAIRHQSRKTTFEPGASATKTRTGAIRHWSRPWPAYRSDELDLAPHPPPEPEDHVRTRYIRHWSRPWPAYRSDELDLAPHPPPEPEDHVRTRVHPPQNPDPALSATEAGHGRPTGRMSSIGHRIRHPDRRTGLEPGASATKSGPGAIRHWSRPWPAYSADELLREAIRHRIRRPPSHPPPNPEAAGRSGRALDLFWPGELHQFPTQVVAG